MKELTIFVRKDLNMRKGKMAAQCAHAAMKLLLEIMKPEKTKLILEKDNDALLSEFLNSPTVKIIMVSNEDGLHNSPDKNLPFSIIIDNGRTEFNGIPTATCSAQGIFSNHIKHELYVPQTYGEGIKAKELFVFSKQNPIPKENACSLSVILCLKMLYSKMKNASNGDKYIDLAEVNALSAWISGAFGKIAVSTKDDAGLNELNNVLSKKGILTLEMKSGENRCLVIEPMYPVEIDPYTRELSLI